MKFGMSIGQTITNNHTKFHYKSESRSEDTNDSFRVCLVGAIKISYFSTELKDAVNGYLI